MRAARAVASTIGMHIHRSTSRQCVKTAANMSQRYKQFDSAGQVLEGMSNLDKAKYLTASLHIITISKLQKLNDLINHIDCQTFPQARNLLNPTGYSTHGVAPCWIQQVRYPYHQFES